MSNGTENGARKVRVQSPFHYVIAPDTINAGADATFTLRVEAATDFIWFKSSYQADDAAAVGGQEQASIIIPSIDVQIQVTGADRNLLDTEAPLTTLFGDGKLPFVLPAPMTILANSEVVFNFTSREAARNIDLRLVLHGLKDYGELEVQR